MSQVNDNYVHLMKILLNSGVYHGIATHDEKMILATFPKCAQPLNLSTEKKRGDEKKQCGERGEETERAPAAAFAAMPLRSAPEEGLVMVAQSDARLLARLGSVWPLVTRAKLQMVPAEVGVTVSLSVAVAPLAIKSK